MDRMTLTLALLVLRTQVALHGAVGDLGARRDERGDVPGWVLITVMTAGLVGGLWKFAGPRLQSMLNQALGSVSG